MLLILLWRRQKNEAFGEAYTCSQTGRDRVNVIVHSSLSQLCTIVKWSIFIWKMKDILFLSFKVWRYSETYNTHYNLWWPGTCDLVSCIQWHGMALTLRNINNTHRKYRFIWTRNNDSTNRMDVHWLENNHKRWKGLETNEVKFHMNCVENFQPRTKMWAFSFWWR